MTNMSKISSCSRFLTWLMAMLLVAFTAGCGGGGGGGRDPILGGPNLVAPGLVSVAVTPAAASIPMGAPQQFKATATYSDGSSVDVTASSAWTSGTTAAATINGNSGLAAGVAIGTSVITASFGGVAGTSNLTVIAATLVSIAVAPPAASIPSGLTQRFVATGTYTDGTTVDISAIATWTSNNLPIATVASPGIATGAAVGVATITVTSGGKAGTATLTVTPATLSSIAVTPLVASIPMGLTQAFAATGTFSDGTSRDISNTVTWTSGTPAIATVVSPGVATGVSVGVAAITATSGAKSGSAALTVTPATLSSIVVTPLVASIPSGLTQRFVATGTFSDGTSLDISNSVTWTSGAVAVATVVSPGIATGQSAGVATITASIGGKSGAATLTVTAATLTSIVVTPAAATVPSGLTQGFVATGTFSNGTSLDISNTVAWSSGAIAVATVVSPGIATGVSVGTATITATSAGKSGSATLTVTVATLSSIAVTPAAASVAIGGTQAFIAKGTYSDGSIVDITAGAIWTSSNLAAATVLPSGVATGLSGGLATITATSGGKSGSGALTVVAGATTLNSIAVTPAAASVAIGGTQAFVATGTYSDGSVVDITAIATWTSSNLPAATVLPSGVATGVSGGVATITATSGGKSGSGALTVVAGATTLNSIAVTPAAASVAVGGTQAFVATGTYSDGSVVDITAIATWTSNNLAVATVLPSGVATGVTAGAATIAATSGAKSGSGVLTVNAALGPPAVNLGLAGNFASLSKAGITDVPASAITGNIGASPISGAAIGVTCAEVTGRIYAVDAAGPAPCTVIDPVMLTTAVSNMESAYTDAAGRPAGVGPNLNLGGGTVAGQTLVPGTYTWGSNVTITTDLTLNGGPNDVWLFQITGTLNISPNMKVALTGGALPKNVFWQVAGAVTLGTGSHFEGNILAQTNIAMNTGASINGRLLAQTGVSLQSNAVTIPAP